MAKLNLRPKAKPLGHPQNPIPLPGKRRIVVTKKMLPYNPFDVDPEDLMPNPYDDETPAKMKVYRFLADGTAIEASTQDYYTWRCIVKNPDGKVVKSKTAYSEAAAREFVEREGDALEGVKK